jgi:hypothetical protein
MVLSDSRGLGEAGVEEEEGEVLEEAEVAGVAVDKRGGSIKELHACISKCFIKKLKRTVLFATS